MQGSFGGLDLLVLVTVAIALESTVAATLVVIAPQELGHFELDRFLEHELSAHADRFRERGLARSEAQELFFNELAG